MSSKPPKKLFFLRHGHCGYHAKYIGSTDVELNEEGKAQVAMTGPRLLKAGITKIICSPMRRCLQSAEELRLDVELELDDRLREVDFGHWEKKSFDEIAAQHPNLVSQWAENPLEFIFPGGESMVDFISRATTFQQSIINSSHKNVLVISHGGVIRFLLCLFLSFKLENYLLFQVQKGKIATLELYDKGGILTGLNC